MEEEKAPAVTVKKKGFPVSDMIIKALSVISRRNGMSLDVLKRALGAGGYDVVKNRKRINGWVRKLVEKGIVTQIKGSFKMNREYKIEAKKKAVAIAKKKAIAQKRAVSLAKENEFAEVMEAIAQKRAVAMAEKKELAEVMEAIAQRRAVAIANKKEIAKNREIIAQRRAAKKRDLEAKRKMEEEKAPAVTAKKKLLPTSEMIIKAMSVISKRNGMSFDVLRRAMGAGGYDVVKKRKLIISCLGKLVEKGIVIRTKCAFKLSREYEIEAKKNAVAIAQKKAVAQKRAVALAKEKEIAKKNMEVIAQRRADEKRKLEAARIPGERKSARIQSMIRTNDE